MVKNPELPVCKESENTDAAFRRHLKALREGQGGGRTGFDNLPPYKKQGSRVCDRVPTPERRVNASASDKQLEQNFERVVMKRKEYVAQAEENERQFQGEYQGGDNHQIGDQDDKAGAQALVAAADDKPFAQTEDEFGHGRSPFYGSGLCFLNSRT